MEITKLLEKLEKEIIQQNLYQKCKEYYMGCPQCDFWKKFDELKKEIIEVQNV